MRTPLTAVLATLVAVAGGCSEAQPPAPAPAVVDVAPKTVAWNAWFVDDPEQIGLKVVDVDCGHTSLSGGGETIVADGSTGVPVWDVLAADGKAPADPQFCLVTIQIVNSGPVARYVMDHTQYAVDAAGVIYHADLKAAAAANGGRVVWTDLIAPSTKPVTRVLVFDVPKVAELVAVELHATDASAGGRVEFGPI